MKIIAIISALLLAGCASQFRYGNCMDDAAVSCRLTPNCQVALWHGNPGHVQAFEGRRWLHAGHDGWRLYVFEGVQDIPRKPDRIFGRDEYFEYYERWR